MPCACTRLLVDGGLTSLIDSAHTAAVYYPHSGTMHHSRGSLSPNPVARHRGRDKGGPRDHLRGGLLRHHRRPGQACPGVCVCVCVCVCSCLSSVVTFIQADHVVLGTLLTVIYLPCDLPAVCIPLRCPSSLKCTFELTGKPWVTASKGSGRWAIRAGNVGKGCGQ